MPIIVRAERRPIPAGAAMPESSGSGYAAPAVALQGLGGAITNLGAAVEQADDFETKLKTTEFVNREQQRLDQSIYEYKGDGRDLPTNWQRSHDEERQRLIASMPNGKAKQQAMLTLEQARGSLSMRAINAGQQVVTGNMVAKAENHVTGAFSQFKTLDEIDLRSQQADLVINAIPGITESQRQALRRKGAETLEANLANKVLQGEIDPGEAEAFMGRFRSANDKPTAPQSARSATSPRGIEFLKRIEGERDVGWDYQQYSGPYGVRRGKDEKLTLAQAEARLKEEVASVEKDMAAKIKAPISQNQHDALASFFYNLGTGKGRLDKVAEMINSGRADQVPAYMRQFTRAGGEVLKGLINRREKEAALFTEAGGGTAEPAGDGDLSVVESVRSRFGRKPEAVAKAIEIVRKKQDADKYVEGVITGALDYNPHDDKARKLVDQKFQESGFGDRIFQGDPGAQDAAVRLMERLKRAPEAIANGVAGLVTSKDPTKQARGYDMIVSMRRNAPHAFEGVSSMKQHVEDADTYQELATRLGADEAMKRMQEMKSPEYEKIRKGAAKDLREAFKDVGIAEFDKRFDDTSWPWYADPKAANGSNAIKNSMLAEFRELAEHHFLQTGDKEVAMNIAAREMKRTVGVSEMFGKKIVMPYPPERVFGSQYKAEMEADLKKEVGTYVPDADLSTIRLVPDGRTRDGLRTGQPSYRVQVMRNKGEFSYPYVLPGRWPSPDTMMSFKGKAIEDQIQKEALQQKKDTATEAAATGAAPPRKGKPTPGVLRQMYDNMPALGDN